MESAFPRLPVICWVERGSYPALRQALAEREFRVLALDGGAIDGRAAFFAQAARDLPQDPPNLRPNLDALNDSLWGGIDALEAHRVAIIWTHADVLLANDAEMLVDALDVFRQVASDLREGQVELFVFLVGTGRSFKPFSAHPPFRER